MKKIAIITAIAVAVISLAVQQYQINSLSQKLEAKADNVSLKIDETKSITLVDFISKIFEYQLAYEKSQNNN